MYLSLEELISSNKFINYDIATKLKKFILNKYHANYSHHDFSEYILVCLDAVHRDEKSYDSTRGVLFSYLVTSINGALLTKYATANKGTIQTSIEYVNFTQVDEVPNVDLSKYNNREVLAMYRVTEGTAIKKDLAIVKGLTNYGLQ